MAINIQEQLIRELSDLSKVLAVVMERSIYGSYSDRTPSLGKMRTCLHCRKRYREFDVDDRHCNPSHATSVDRIDTETGKHYQAKTEPRVTDVSIKKLVKKFTAKHHSNKKRKLIHDIALRLQNEEFRNTTQLLLEGLVGFYAPLRPVDIASIPAFAEKVVVAERKARARTKRQMQKESRRINFGLIS